MKNPKLAPYNGGHEFNCECRVCRHDMFRKKRKRSWKGWAVICDDLVVEDNGAQCICNSYDDANELRLRFQIFNDSIKRKKVFSVSEVLIKER